MKGDTNDKIVTAVFIVVLIIAIGTYTYISLPKEKTENKSTQPHQTEEYVLTLNYGNKSVEYTMSELKEMPSISGYGGYIKRSGTVVGPDQYRGVKIGYLIDYLSPPENYSLVVTSPDGYQVNYTIDNVSGKVEIYNVNGTPLGIGNVTMIVAYQKDGKDLDRSNGGPLRIAFVSDEGYITSSKLWAKSVASIEVKG